MSDDKTKRGAQDRVRINVYQDYERRDWAQTLGISEDELREAVRNVGHRIVRRLCMRPDRGERRRRPTFA